MKTHPTHRGNVRSLLALAIGLLMQLSSEATSLVTFNPGDLIAVDAGTASVLHISPSSGNRTVIASNTVGSGAVINYPAAVVSAPNGAVYYLEAGEQSSARGVVAVNPSNGLRMLISGGAAGSGHAFVAVKAMCWDDSSASLLVADVGTSASTAGIVRVNPITGQRVVVTGIGVGGGVAIHAPKFVTCAPNGTIYYFETAGAQANRVIEVNPATGVRTAISGGVLLDVLGIGANFVNVNSISWDPATSSVLVADTGLATLGAGLIRVNVSTGARTFLTGGGIGLGTLLTAPTCVLGSVAGTAYYIESSLIGGVQSLVCATGLDGLRAILSGVTQGLGTGLTNILSLAIVPTPPPQMEGSLAASATYRSSFSYQIPSVGVGTTYSLGGTLPDGLSFNWTTGIISGTPTATGIYRLVAGASNSGGTTTALLTLTVNKAPLMVNGIAAVSRPFNGTTEIALSLENASLIGVVPGDDVSLSTANVTAALGSHHAGPAKPVTCVGFALTGTAADHYTLTQPSAAVTISAAPVTITADGGLSKNEGQADPSFTYTVTSGVLFDGDTLTGALSRVSGETAGTYAITLGTLSAGGNYELSLVPALFTIDSNTAPVATPNRAPTFTAGGNVSVAQGGGAQTIAAWAKNISAGAVDEAAQTLHFEVSVDNPSLFATPPAIAPNGTLTFAPAPKADGSATVTVTLHDNGGTSDGGDDTSAPVTFRLAVTTYLQELGAYNGLVQSDPSTTPAHESTGLVRVVVGKKGAFTGRLALGGIAYVLRGNFDQGGMARFGKAPKTTASLTLKRKNKSALTLTLQLDVGQGSHQLSGVVTAGGAPFAVLDADRALYTSKKNPASPLRNVPAELLGRYTVVFVARTPAEQGLAAEQYPQGHGCGLLTVGASGMARFTGYLADGTKISVSNALSKDHRLPFYAPLAAGRGSISGVALFRDRPELSDIDGLEMRWFKPANALAKYYPAGWQAGIKTDLLGSKFVIPAAKPPTCILNRLGVPDADGNAQVEFLDGNLGPNGLTKPLNVTALNLATVVGANLEQTKVLLGATTQVIGSYEDNGIIYPLIKPGNELGQIGGSFIHPASQTAVTLRGVVFQKQQIGLGFFLGSNQSGSLSVTAK